MNSSEATRRRGRIDAVLAGTVLALLVPGGAGAQVLGTFKWQTQPYCNVITVTVTQQGNEFFLDGTDDQCGASQKAAVRGLGFFNLDGSVGFGLTIVTAPGGAPVHVDAALTIPALSGPWHDSAGLTGQFVFGPGSAGLPLRPANGIGAAAINPSQVQRRVTGSCPANQVIAGVNENGSVTCQAITGAAGGDITSVTAGAGLLGGGTTGDVALGVSFGGPGSAAQAARSDHRHEVGASSVAIGAGALAAQANASDNVAVGRLALATDTIGNQNTAVGALALRSGSLVAANTAIGYSAMSNVVSAKFNVAVGESTLERTQTDSGVALGHLALASNTTGTANTAVGATALTANTTGTDNTATGYQALWSNTVGTRNTAFGSGAMQYEASGVANTAVGNRALTNHVTGNGNVAVGDSALTNATSGDDSVAVGYGALASNTIGAWNTGIGMSALNANTTGNGNTGVGRYALAAGTWGGGNTGIGYDALKNANGAYNVGIGFGAGMQQLDGVFNVFIGASAAGLPTDTRTIRIGGAENFRAFIAGVRGVSTGAADAVPVVIDSSGQLGTVSSSRRYKDHIRDLGAVSRGIFKLRPVSFTYTQPFADGSTPVQYGLIAEEVNDVMPELVARNKDGEIETVKYHVLPTLLLAEVQRLERERVAQHDEIGALRALVEQLQRQLAASPR